MKTSSKAIIIGIISFVVFLIGNITLGSIVGALIPGGDDYTFRIVPNDGYYAKSVVLGTEDITYEYFDTQSRLEIYETQYDRLLKLLKEAEEMEDIIW